jgi:putative cardiolipin synthase
MTRLRLLLLTLALALLQGCASLSPVAKPESHALALSDHTPLGQAAMASLPPGAPAGVRPLVQSDFAMDARLTLMAQAQRSLDLQYYLLQNDTTGRLLLRGLRDAAARGVRVRLLVDDLYTASSDHLLLALAAYPNVEVRLFNPFAAGRGYMATRLTLSLFDFARVNRRMHNKMFIADGAFGIAGGRNIADEYFFHNTQGNFIDFDLLLAGAPVAQMAAVFDDYWNSPHVYPVQALASGLRRPEALREMFERETAPPPGTPPFATGTPQDVLGYRPFSVDLALPPLRLLPATVSVFADSPDKVDGRAESGQDPTTVTNRFIGALARVRGEVLLISPYFVPSEVGLSALRRGIANGQQVTVMTNALGSGDEPLVGAAYARRRLALLRMGVALYEVSSGELKKDPLIAKALGETQGRSHAKLAVIDGRTVFVGSMNMDLRSSRENTELGMLVESPQLAAMVSAVARRVREVGSYQLRLDSSKDGIEWVTHAGGKDQVHRDDPELDAWTRLQILLLSPFIPDSLL